MCDKLPYCAKRIDPCMVEEIDIINASGTHRTRASCCGHGRYPKTIVVQNKFTKFMYEMFSGRQIYHLYLNGKPRKRFYRKDEQGFYYIPEVRDQ